MEPLLDPTSFANSEGYVPQNTWDPVGIQQQLRGIVYLLGLLDPPLLLDLFPLKGRMMVLAMIPGESENSPN